MPIHAVPRRAMPTTVFNTNTPPRQLRQNRLQDEQNIRFGERDKKMTSACETPLHATPAAGQTSLEKQTALLQAAKEACLKAGALIMANFGKTHTIDTKSTAIDLVTEIDRQSDALIRGILHRAEPDAFLLTEETFNGKRPIRLDKAWVVDPLDGTNNYAHHYPHFAVSIAYVEQGVPQVAAVLDVPRGNLYTAIRGQGAWCGERRLQVTQTEALGQAKLATDFPSDFLKRRNKNFLNFQRLNHVSQGVLRPGAGTLDTTYTASGHLDGFWQIATHPWDQAAAVLLLEEAGGQVTDFQGNPIDLGKPDFPIVGSNGKIHAQLLAQLQGSTSRPSPQ